MVARIDMVKVDPLDFDTTYFLRAFKVTEEAFALSLGLFDLVFPCLRKELNIELLMLLAILSLQVLILRCASHFDSSLYRLRAIELFLKHILFNLDVLK